MSYLLPHLATIIGQLVQLIGEAETLESKRRVDTALNAVIEKTGHQVGFTFIWIDFFTRLYTLDITFRVDDCWTPPSSMWVADRIKLSLELDLTSTGSSAGDDWLFKASLLVTVTKLVEAIKEQSSMLGAVVVPLVQESLSPNVCFLIW